MAYVIDACKVSIMPAKLEEKLDAIRRKVNQLGQYNQVLRVTKNKTTTKQLFLIGCFPAIPQLVLMTKVDEACPLVAQDIANIYRSCYIKETVRSPVTHC